MSIAKECTACRWDGTLTRLACPSCKTENWYCQDCDGFNCAQCQLQTELEGLVF
jgi:hypothetical protein